MLYVHAFSVSNPSKSSSSINDCITNKNSGSAKLTVAALEVVAVILVVVTKNAVCGNNNCSDGDISWVSQGLL